MFDRVAQPQIDMYDGITNKYLARAVFKVTPEVERKILNFVNTEKFSNEISLQDMTFYPATADYILPLPYEKYSRKGILRVLVRDRYSLLWIPVEIRARFYLLGRTAPTQGQFHFDSMELSDFVVERMTFMPNQVLEQSK